MTNNEISQYLDILDSEIVKALTQAAAQYKDYNTLSRFVNAAIIKCQKIKPV